MFDELRAALSYNPRTGAIIYKDDRTNAIRNGANGPYVVISARAYHAGKVAWLLAMDDWPRGLYYVNGDKTDLRRNNLLDVTPAEAKALDKQRAEEAKRKATAHRATLPKGVIECRDTGLYYARVLVRGHIHVSPRVATAAEARALRDAMLNPLTT